MKQTPKFIYKLYKKHAVVETVIEELKNDFGLGISHNRKMNFNQTLTQLVGITYNIKVLFLKMKAEVEESHLKIIKLSTFQKQFLHIPAILVNHSGRKILKLSRYNLQIMEKMLLHFEYKPI